VSSDGVIHSVGHRTKGPWATDGGLATGSGLELRPRSSMPRMEFAFRAGTLSSTFAVVINLALTVVLVNRMRPVPAADAALTLNKGLLLLGLLTVTLMMAPRWRRQNLLLDDGNQPFLVTFALARPMRLLVLRLGAISLPLFGFADLVVARLRASRNSMRDSCEGSDGVGALVSECRLAIEQRQAAVDQLTSALLAGGLATGLLLWLLWVRATMRWLHLVDNASVSSRHSRLAYVSPQRPNQRFAFSDCVPTSFSVLAWLKIATAVLLLAGAVGAVALFTAAGRNSDFGFTNVASTTMWLVSLAGVGSSIALVVLTTDADRPEGDIYLQPMRRPLPWYGIVMWFLSSAFIVLYAFGVGITVLIELSFGLGYDSPEPFGGCRFGSTSDGSSFRCNTRDEQREILAERRTLMLALGTATVVAQAALLAPKLAKMCSRPSHQAPVPTS
jgi:hypothetical protein